MSLKLMNIILFFTIFLFKFIKNEEDQLENNNQPLRFLVDEKSSKIAYTKFKYEPEEYNLIDRVRELNPLQLFSAIASNEEENKSFNVRCFWVDLETLRVYDLIKLKTKK